MRWCEVPFGLPPRSGSLKVGAPVLDPTSERAVVRFPRATRLVILINAHPRNGWVLNAVAKRLRFEQFSLALHPDKTRLLEFGRYAAARRKQRGLGKPETFTFLGFTFICGKARRGAFQLQRKTRRDRMRAKLREVKEQLRKRRHEPIPEQGRWLKQVVTGFFVYHAVPTNSRALSAFRHHVTGLWLRALRRRSQKDSMTWARLKKIADTWLPQPRILHPWPSQRFAVNHPRWEPGA